MKEIILHAGLHKTGTTSIQNTLFTQSKSLENEGILYPKCWVPNHSIPLYSAFCDNPEQYHMNIREGYTNEQIKGNNEKNLSDLEFELANKEWDKLILSGEDLVMLTSENLVNLKNFLNRFGSVKVVFYVRNPIQWGVSIIQEKIKGGLTYSQALEDTKGIVSANFKHHVGKFVEVFRNVQLYRFEDAIKEGIVKHFLSVAGYTEEVPLTKSNESLSWVSIRLIDYINQKLPLIVDGKLNEKRTNGDIFPLFHLGGDKFDIPISDKQILQESSCKDVEWLNHYFEIDYSHQIEPTESQYRLTEELISEIRSIEVSEHLKNIIEEYLESL